MNAEQDERKIETGVSDSANAAAEGSTQSAPEPRTQTHARAKLDADTYAVGIHVLRLAPGWLLTTSVCFVLLLLMLSWVRPGANASGEIPSAPNDSKAALPHVSTTLNTASQPKAVVPAKESDASQPAVEKSTTNAASTSNEAALTTTPASPVVAQGASNDASASSAQQSTTQTGSFTVQAGSHTDESSANEQVSALRAAGFDARTVVAELPGRGRWFRVQSGRFDDRAEASKEAARIRSKGLAPSAIVVPVQD